MQTFVVKRTPFADFRAKHRNLICHTSISLAIWKCPPPPGCWHGCQICYGTDAFLSGIIFHWCSSNENNHKKIIVNNKWSTFASAEFGCWIHVNQPFERVLGSDTFQVPFFRIFLRSRPRVTRTFLSNLGNFSSGETDGKFLSVWKNFIGNINLGQTSRLNLDKFGIGNDIPDWIGTVRIFKTIDLLT